MKKTCHGELKPQPILRCCCDKWNVALRWVQLAHELIKSKLERIDTC